MKFGRGNKLSTKYRSTVGFTQVLLSIVALGLMGIGIFSYINPSVLGFGNASIVMMFVGAMILVLGMMTALLWDFHYSQIKAWGGALFVLFMLVIAIVIMSTIYEGGVLNG